jgi:hypothetical protein
MASSSHNSSRYFDKRRLLIKKGGELSKVAPPVGYLLAIFAA